LWCDLELLLEVVGFAAVSLCHLALDGYQQDAAARWGRTDLPTFHLPQLVAFALGVPAETLGLNKHLIDPRKVLVDRDLIA